jgi:NAD(P)-dependent dehydrogenase (short-subunit alcohol dehydrogenase family)
MRLTDSDVVLVTGGASGLGAATVESVLATGARAVIIDLPQAIAKADLDERVIGLAADVRDEAQVQAVVDRALELGTLRVAVNCAGVATPGRIVGKRGTLPLADFQRVIDINLVGTFNVLRLAATAMAANDPLDGDRGLIVMTASVAAYDGQIGQAAYAASKGGVLGLTLPVARDLSGYGIRVMTIMPGLFYTPMFESVPEEFRKSLAASVPFPSRLGRADEYAALVRAIVENDMLNGESIRLDGALRMQPK